MRWKWIAAVFGLGLVALAVVLSVELPASALGDTLARRAARRLGVELTRGRFRLSVLDGLVLEDGEALAATKGRRYRVELPRVVFEHRPRALLRGVLDVRAIRFERPRLSLVEVDGLEPPPAETGEGANRWVELRFDLDEVVLEAAEVRLADAGGDDEDAEPGSWPSRLEGVDVRLRDVSLPESARGLLAIEGSGSFIAGSARFGELAIEDARADLYLHEGRTSLTLLKFRAEGAPFVAEMRVDWTRSPFGYDVSSLGEPFDAAPLVGARPGSLGEDSLLVEVFGRGPTPAGFRAQGSLTLPEGALGDVPVLEAANETLGREVFGAADPREASVIVYRVRDGYVLFQPFELSVGDAVAAIRGRAYLDGPLELELEVRESDGRRTPLGVGGTVTRPSARPSPGSASVP